MALIDKDQIRAEIKRRYDATIGRLQEGNYILRKERDFDNGKAKAYAIILSFLDTLPEQTESTIMTNEMLMGEIKLEQPVIKKSNALFDECVENCDPAVMKEVSDNVDKMLGRKPVEGLEEAAKEYMKKARKHLFDDSPIGRADDAFIAGAEWGASHAKTPTP